MPWSKVLVEKQSFDFEEFGEQGERKISYVSAIKEAVDLALAQDDRVYVMGQGVDDPSGMFGTTLNLHKKETIHSNESSLLPSSNVLNSLFPFHLTSSRCRVLFLPTQE